jgi:hypothetical protein
MKVVGSSDSGDADLDRVDFRRKLLAPLSGLMVKRSARGEGSEP